MADSRDEVRCSNADHLISQKMKEKSIFIHLYFEGKETETQVQWLAQAQKQCLHLSPPDSKLYSCPLSLPCCWIKPFLHSIWNVMLGNETSLKCWISEYHDVYSESFSFFFFPPLFVCLLLIYTHCLEMVLCLPHKLGQETKLHCMASLGSFVGAAFHKGQSWASYNI